MLFDITNWFIDRISGVWSFICIILILSTLLFLSFLIIKGKEKTTLSPELNYWTRSLGVVVKVGILLVIFGLIFLVLLFTAIVNDTGAPNPFLQLTSAYFGDAASAIFASETNVIIMFLVFAAVVLMVLGAGIKSAYRIGFGWSLVMVLITIGMYFGMDYLLNEFVYEGGLTGGIQWIGDYLEDLVRNLAFPENI